MGTFYSILFLCFTIISYAQVHVRGYYRKDGTYLRSHERTRPNSTVTDNYSYGGNYNLNLEYNPLLPTSTYNYNGGNSNTGRNSISNYGSVKGWVSGYYRSDGVYVNDYYLHRPKFEIPVLKMFG